MSTRTAGRSFAERALGGNKHLLARWGQWQNEHTDRGCGDVFAGCRCECADHRCYERYAPRSQCASCGDSGYIRYVRAISHPNFGRMEPCPMCNLQGEARFGRLARRIRGTINPEVVTSCTLTQFGSSQLTMNARGWLGQCRDGDQPWLVLWGEAGGGKTHLAFSLAHDRAVAGWRVYVATAGDWLQTLRDAYDQREEEFGAVDPRRSSRGADLVVIDDLGKEHVTAWGYAELFGLLDARYRERMPTVITMNLPGGPPMVNVRDPLWSRVFGSASRVLEVRDRDHREPERNAGPGVARGQ